MIDRLKNALENDNEEVVRSFAVNCKSTISLEIERMAGNYEIKRDLFSETNYITESIRRVILDTKKTGEHENKMVAVGG